MTEVPQFHELELTEDALPRVPLRDVLDIQSLAMGTIRPLSRTRGSNRDPHITKFVLLHETNPNVKNVEDLIQAPNAYGEYERDVDVDTYFGVVVRKPGPREWRLTISFLQNVLGEQTRLTYLRDLYRFEWRRGEDEALGTRMVIYSVGQLVAKSQFDTENGLSYGYTEKRLTKVDRSLLAQSDCHKLRAKIVEHADLFLGMRAA